MRANFLGTPVNYYRKLDKRVLHPEKLHTCTAMVVRTLRFAAKLNSSTHRALNAFLTAQRHLWNAALGERIGAYEKCGKSISAYDQFKSLTLIGPDDPDYAMIAVTAQRSILFRLDQAFKAFFERVRQARRETRVPALPFHTPCGALVRDKLLPHPSTGCLARRLHQGHWPFSIQRGY